MATLQQLLEAGCHFGHQSKRWNPKMKQYLFTQRDGVHIFDLVKTKEGLDKALEFVRALVTEGKTIVFVGTKRQAAGVVSSLAQKAQVPYVSERWLGGTLTNFEQMRKRVEKMKDLKDKREKGELTDRTKKERLLIDREITKLERFFGGVAALDKLPDALFVVDTHKEDTAVREAKRLGIKIVGIVDSNGDPDGIDFLIAANDDAVGSISLIVEEVANAVITARSGEVIVEEQPVKKGKKKVITELDEVEVQPEEV